MVKQEEVEMDGEMDVDLGEGRGRFTHSLTLQRLSMQSLHHSLTPLQRLIMLLLEGNCIEL